MKKFFAPILFLFWMTFIISAFFVVQKPEFLMIPRGIANLLQTILLPAWIAFLAAAIGNTLLPQADHVERLTIGTALGLGIFGLVGFGLAISGFAKPVILLTLLILLTGIIFWSGNLNLTRHDILLTIQEIRDSTNGLPKWIPLCMLITLSLAFLLGLAPPSEDFDALFYHLTVPTIWLKQGQDLSFVPIPHYWYPQIVEGMYVWPLSLGTDTATHLIHLLWLVLTIVLIWHWAKQVAGNIVAWSALALVLTMPSLPWLASWSYTDYALTFAGLAMLYSLWRWKTAQLNTWFIIGGLMAGLAVSVKYTGFVVPLSGVILLLIWERRLEKAILFGLIGTLAASPWYLRNWIGTGNPIYPFVFGGLGWDKFLAQHYAASGTGLGWNSAALIALPLTATLGTKDANYFDGRIGPFFLILLPMLLFSFWNLSKSPAEKKFAVQAIGIFSLIGISFWTFGVISSAHLFQTRLLFPILIPMTIPYALGLEAISYINLPQLKISFIVRTILALVVIVNLVNLSLQITSRNPLAVILGITKRESYIANQQPVYANALDLIRRAPSDARIFFLFEPRSYGMTAHVQPDSILSNFDHSVWLYRTPQKIINAWKHQGYTHILISNFGENFYFKAESTSQNKIILEEVLSLLQLIEASSKNYFSLYKIP